MLNKYWPHLVLGLLILTVNVFRFIDLNGVPNGFMFDEETSGVTLQCLVEEGIAPLDTKIHYPLFADVGIGSPKPPTYLYPGMVWTKMFGFSPAAVRSFTVFTFIIALIGLFFIGRHLGGTLCGLWTLTAASISPWTWTFTRVGWESPLVLTFFIWGLFTALSAKKNGHFILAGILFSAAAYTYPPARMQVPLFFVIFALYGIKRLNWKTSQLALMTAALGITSIPLIYSLFTDPALSMRLNTVSLTNPEYLAKVGKSSALPDILSMVFNNVLVHLKPAYLFFKGIPKDPGLTTGRQGIIGWLGVLALVMGLWRVMRAWHAKQPPAQKGTLIFMGFLAVNILIGMLPSIVTALENQGWGNNLRSIQAWPFAMIAAGFIIHRSTAQGRWTWIVPALTAVIFSAFFLTQYFKFYKDHSVWMFRRWSLEEAQNAKTTQDWLQFLYRHQDDRFASRYFLMRYHKDTCLQAKKTQEDLNPLFKKLRGDAKAQQGQHPLLNKNILPVP